MTTACAPAPPTAVAEVWAEMVASLANMVESALAGDGLASGDAVDPTTAVADGPGEAVADDPGRVEGDRGASRAGGDRLRAPVDADAGPRAHRVHDAAVRPGRAGGPAGLGGRGDRGDRFRSGAVGPVRHASRRVQAAGRPGLR